MPKNDPSETGGLFISRRPGTAPTRFHRHELAHPARRLVDQALAACILLGETLLCLSVLGPQPAAWLWAGSQVQYLTGSVALGLATGLLGMLGLLLVTLAIAKRLDHAWKLVRRAAGYDQQKGALETIFVISVAVATVAFVVWFFVIAGPGPELAPRM